MGNVAKPNIVFYFTDQQRWDTMGCYGQRLPITPVLDNVAKEGTLFQNAYTCQPVCGPARACLQSGKFASEVGCYRNDKILPQDIPTLASQLKKAGYHTGYVGKLHLASDAEKGINHRTSAVPLAYRAGFDEDWMAADALELTSHGYNGYVFDRDNNRVDFTGYRVDCINDFGIDFLHKQTKDQPFFLFMSHIDPHHQNDHHRYEGPDGSRTQFADFDVPEDLQGHSGDWQENYPDYLGQCHRLDTCVGRMIDTLKEQQMWDNTIFIYCADHGSHFCTRNEEYKRSCHDSCTHIPLIIHGPGFNKESVIGEPVSLIDLPTTILSCAGAEVPDGFQGRDLGKLVNHEVEAWDDAVFIQISESQVGRALRTKEWKYSVRARDKDGWYDDASDTYTEDFLYDLKNDPYEQVNLVADEAYKAVRAKLAARLISLMQKAHEPVPTILPYTPED